MDTTNISSCPDDSGIEKTSCGVPNTADLLEEGSKWIKNLQLREYLDADNTLTRNGKDHFFHPSFKRNWVSEDVKGIHVHTDFDVAKSVVDNLTIGNPKQQRVNDLCLNLTLSFCFTENQKKRAGDGPYKTALEKAQMELKQAYSKWYDHVCDDGRATRDPTWDRDDKPVTMRIAKAAHNLTRLVMEPEDNTDIQQGQVMDLSDYWDPNTFRPELSGATSSKSKRQASIDAGHSQYDDLSRPNSDLGSTGSRQPPGRERAGLLGGMIVPSGDGHSAGVGRKRFPDATKKGGNSAADVLRQRINKSINRMAE
jgi:hypothetical protein